MASAQDYLRELRAARKSFLTGGQSFTERSPHSVASPSQNTAPASPWLKSPAPKPLQAHAGQGEPATANKTDKRTTRPEKAAASVRNASQAYLASKKLVASPQLTTKPVGRQEEAPVSSTPVKSSTTRQAANDEADSDNISQLIDQLSLTSPVERPLAPRRGSKMDMLRRKFSTSSVTPSIGEPVSSVGSASRTRGRSSVSIGDQKIIISGISDEEIDSGSLPSTSSSTSSSSDATRRTTARKKRSAAATEASSVPEEASSVSEEASSVPEVASSVPEVASSVPEVASSTVEASTVSSSIANEVTASASSVTDAVSSVAEEAVEAVSSVVDVVTEVSSSTETESSEDESSVSGETSEEGSTTHTNTNKVSVYPEKSYEKSSVSSRREESSKLGNVKYEDERGGESIKDVTASSSTRSSAKQPKAHPKRIHKKPDSSRYMTNKTDKTNETNKKHSKKSAKGAADRSPDRSRRYSSDIDKKVSGNHNRDRKASEKRDRDRKASEKRDRDRKASEKRDRDRKASGKRDRDRKASGKRDRDRKASEKRDRDRKASEKPVPMMITHDHRRDSQPGRHHHHHHRLPQDQEVTWADSEDRTEASESLVVSYQRRVAYGRASGRCRHCRVQAWPPAQPSVAMVLPPGAASLAALAGPVPVGAGDDDPVVAALLVQQIALTRHFLEVQRRTHATYRRLLRSHRHAYVHRDDLKDSRYLSEERDHTSRRVRRAAS